MKPLADTDFAPACAPGGSASGEAGEAAPLRVDLLRVIGLAAEERARWHRLSAQAAPGNLFALDWFMEPALRHCGPAAGLRLAVVRQTSGEWLGAVPLTFAARLGRLPLPIRQTWLATNQFTGTPLVLPGAQKAFWQALLARLDHHPGLALALCCETMPLDDPATLALASLCSEQGRMIAQISRSDRPALLARAGGASDPRPRRRLDQRLDALERRLAAELGETEFALHITPDETERWIEAFLALERAGWKGRAHSALACSAATEGLFRETIRSGQRIGAVRLASLRAGGRTVAMNAWFQWQGHGYGFKMTHDEAWRHCAPGRLLMRRVRDLLEAEAPVLFDTCAPAGTHSDAFWPDSRAIGDFVVAIGSPRRQRLLARLLAWRRRLGKPVMAQEGGAADSA